MIRRLATALLPLLLVAALAAMTIGMDCGLDQIVVTF